MFKKSIFAATAFAVCSTAALASVTFDAETGTGFVGKGDVQTAFGWNNQAAQANATAVSFSFQGSTTYSVRCEWDTITGGPRPQTIHHNITVPRNTSVSSSVASDPRRTGQYTGYILSGFGTTTTGGQAVPVVGGTCPGSAQVVGTITEVEETSSTGGLFVTFNGTSVQL